MKYFLLLSADVIYVVVPWSCTTLVFSVDLGAMQYLYTVAALFYLIIS